MSATDPDRTNWQRGGFGSSGAGSASRGTPPPPRRLQTVHDVIDLLQEQLEAVRADVEASTLEKARLIGQLASIALKAIETGNLATRLEALEAILKQRHGKAEP
jgi:hypothetical protein